MKKLRTILAASIIATLSVIGFSGCAQEKVDMSSYAQVIDVRTPEEYATGHLDGAVLMNIQGPDFANQMETLDKSANYFIYCRSGNRSGQAIEIMKQSGFTGNLVNGGGVEDASALSGIEIVQ